MGDGRRVVANKRPAGAAREQRGRARGGRPGTGELPRRTASPRYALVPLALVAAAGVALRIWALQFQPTVTFDGTEYVRFAEALAAGRTFASVFPPGYPLLIALASVIVHETATAAVAVSLVAGALLPVCLWRLARPALGGVGALLPAAAVALHPMLASHAAMTMSESAYVTTIVGAAALAVARRPAWTGAALGLAFAIRPEGLGVAAVLALLAIREVRAGRLSVRGFAFGLASFAAPVLACVLYTHAATGVWTLTPKLAAFHAPTPDWRVLEPGWGAGPAPAGDLTTLLRNAPANAASHAQALVWIWPWPLLALSLWGLGLRRGIELTLLAPFVAFPFLGLTQQGRFELPFVPTLAILAALPLLRPARRALRWSAAAVAVAGALACVAAMGDAFRTPFDGSAIADRRAGEWLASIVEPADVVLDRKPFVAFYAGRPHRMLPDLPYDELVDGAIRNGARWLVLQEYVARSMRPQLAPLLDSAAFRERESRLELVYARADAGGGSLAVFRVLRPGEAKTGVPPVVEFTGFATPKAPAR